MEQAHVKKYLNSAVIGVVAAQMVSGTPATRRAAVLGAITAPGDGPTEVQAAGAIVDIVANVIGALEVNESAIAAAAPGVAGAQK